MLKRKQGLAIVETIIVLAISGLLFTVVIGTFATRRRAAVDDAARQVMSEIARVRNQAQQGYTDASPDIGEELFGTAIEVTSDSPNISVKYLKQNPSNRAISTYNTREITMPSQLRWYISTSAGAFGAGACKDYFNSCNMNGSSSYLTATTYWLVFRNGTGDSYLLTSENFNSEASYIPANQPIVRFAFSQKGSGVGTDAQFKSAPAKYYANFELAIPNNQSLTVVK
jgi:type II secretory pathway pseudopilin PulG